MSGRDDELRRAQDRLHRRLRESGASTEYAERQAREAALRAYGDHNARGRSVEAKRLAHRKREDQEKGR